MDELKPEDVMRALAWYEVVGKNIGSVTIPYNELQAIAAQFREKNAHIKELEEAVGAEFTCFVGEQHKVDRCPYGDELARLQKEVAEKDAEIERLTAYNANLICANTDITNRHKDYLEEAERIARADAITEFAERLKSEVNGGQFASYKGLEIRNVIDQIAKEMKEGSDGSDGVH